MRIVLAQSGGLKGAFQVPILEFLERTEGPPDMYVGVSAGALNTVLAAQGDLSELRALWMGVGDLAPWRWLGSPGDILRRLGLIVSGLIWKPRRGLYDLSELRTCIEERVRLSKLQTKFSCGVVCRETYTYHNLLAEDMTDDQELQKSLLASSAIAGLFDPVDLILAGERRTCSDGGHLHTIPLIPKRYRSQVTHVDLIMTYPLLGMRRSREEVDGLWHSIDWALDISLSSGQIHGLRQMRHLAEQGVFVRIFAPEDHLGGMLDGSESVIADRMRQGELACTRPTIWSYLSGVTHDRTAPDSD